MSQIGIYIDKQKHTVDTNFSEDCVKDQYRFQIVSV